MSNEIDNLALIDDSQEFGEIYEVDIRAIIKTSNLETVKKLLEMKRKHKLTNFISMLITGYYDGTLARTSDTGLKSLDTDFEKVKIQEELEKLKVELDQMKKTIVEQSNTIFTLTQGGLAKLIGDMVSDGTKDLGQIAIKSLRQEEQVGFEETREDGPDIFVPKINEIGTNDGIDNQLEAASDELIEDINEQELILVESTEPNNVEITNANKDYRKSLEGGFKPKSSMDNIRKMFEGVL